MKNICLALLVLVLASACTTQYKIDPIEPKDDAITLVSVDKGVQIVNAQDNSEIQTIFSMGGSSMEADYSLVTQAVVNQLGTELTKRGATVGEGRKQLSIKVTYVKVHYMFAVLKGVVRTEVQMGNGETISFDVDNVTPGNGLRAVNGTVTHTVVKILNHPEVQKYLQSR